MGIILFFVPSTIFGLLSGCNSAWWIAVYLVWGFLYGGEYAEWVNGGRLDSAGIGIFVIDIFVFFVALIISWLFIPSFSFLALFR